MLTIYQKRNAGDAMIAICVCHYFSWHFVEYISCIMEQKYTSCCIPLLQVFSYFSKTSKQDSLYFAFIENGKQYKKLTTAELLPLGIECMHPITAIL